MPKSRTSKLKNSANSKLDDVLASIPKRQRLPIDIRKRSNDARKRLGVTAKQMEGVLRVLPRLRESGLTTEKVIEILEGDDSTDSQTFLSKWRSISKSDRQYLSIEEICVASGLTTRRLWEVICGARFVQAQESVKMLLADSQPAVVKAAIKAATDEVPIMDLFGHVVGHTNGDVKSMDMIAGWTGLKPMPKGSQITFNVGQVSKALPVDVEDDGADDEQLEDMNDMLKNIQSTVAPKQLPAHTAKEVVPAVMDAEFVEVPISVR
jgi:hypothetical protein